MSKRIWTAEQIGPDTVRLLCNGFHLASINHTTDCGGEGWKVNPMSPNHPRSRKYWATAYEAVKGGYGKDAAEAVRAAAIAVRSPWSQLPYWR
jgi:hypothetical protein